MQRRLAGIEIRNDGVRAICAASGMRELRVRTFVDVPFPSCENPEQGWRYALEFISGRIDWAKADCAVSLPADWFSVRNLTLPFRNRKKIKQVLPYQLEPCLPVPVEDLDIDFQISGLSTEASPGVELLTAAIQRERLDSLFDLLERYAVKPAAVVMGGSAVASALAKRQCAVDQWLLADIDSINGTLFVFKGGKIAFIRSIPVKSGCHSLTDALGMNIRRTLMAFREICRCDFRPEIVYLNGEGSADSDFMENLSGTLEAQVQPVRFDLREERTALSPDMGSWHPATMNGPFSLLLWKREGLGGMDFSKGASSAEKRWPVYKTALIKSGILGFLLAGLVGYNIHMEIGSKRSRLDRLNSKIVGTFRSAYPDVGKVVDPLHQMRMLVEKTRDSAAHAAMTGGRPAVVDILDAISRHIPETVGIHLTRLEIGPEGARMSGSADSFNTVDAVKGNLERIAPFRETSISSTSKDHKAGRVRFTIKIELPCD